MHGDEVEDLEFHYWADAEWGRKRCVSLCELRLLRFVIYDPCSIDPSLYLNGGAGFRRLRDHLAALGRGWTWAVKAVDVLHNDIIMAQSRYQGGARTTPFTWIHPWTLQIDSDDEFDLQPRPFSPPDSRCT
jgi:hypothetical protein